MASIRMRSVTITSSGSKYLSNCSRRSGLYERRRHQGLARFRLKGSFDENTNLFSEWGPHDLLEGRMQVAPDHVADLVKKEEAHPLLRDRLVSLRRSRGGPSGVSRSMIGKTRESSHCPADQHGWIHVNLKGREARGIVSPEEYEQTRNKLEQILRQLAASDGRPIVREVFRTARTVEDALVQRLPDLVVHWEDAAFASPLKIKDSGFVSEPVGKKFTGRHARDGFCILREQSGLCDGDTLRASEMHRLIKSSLRNGARVIS